MKCEYQDCGYDTDSAIPKESTVAEKLQLMKMHIGARHAAPPSEVRAEKVKRPQLVVKDGFVTEEAFGYFEHSWKEYKKLAGVTTAVKQHLASCLGEEVSALLYAKFGAEGYDALTEEGLLEAAKGMVVKSRNRLVMQLQLKKILQGPD